MDFRKIVKTARRKGYHHKISDDIDANLDDFEAYCIAKWLREEHELFLVIHPLKTPEGYRFSYFVFNQGGKQPMTFAGSDNWNECHASAIEAALSLLPDLKN